MRMRSVRSSSTEPSASMQLQQQRPSPSSTSPRRQSARAVFVLLSLSVVCIASCLSLVSGNSAGAPPTVCSQTGSALQMPSHSAAFQTSAAPFAILRTGGGSNYTAGVAAPFTLVTTDGGIFLGLLCSVFKATDTAGSQGRLGAVVAGAGQTGVKAVCTSALTHSNANSKTSVSMVWNPPAVAGTGNVHVQCTVVRQQDTFWALPAFTLVEVIPQGSKPDNPTSLQLVGVTVATTSTLSFTFTPPLSQTNIVKYTVERALTSTMVFQGVLNITSTGTAVASYPFSLAGQAANTGYTYRVRSYAGAFDGYGLAVTSGPSVVALTTSSNAATLPQQPTAVNFTLPTLNLTAFLPAYVATQATFIGFDVQYRIPPAAYASGTGTFIPAGTTTYTVPNVPINTQYFVRVRAKSMRGDSAWSADMSLMVTSLCPNACSGQGTCTTPSNVCDCDAGWVGEDCTVPSQVGASGGVKGPICFGAGFCMDWGMSSTTSPALLGPAIPAAEVTDVHFKITAPTAGWVGFLLNAKDGMTGGSGYYFIRDGASNPSSPVTYSYPISATALASPNDDTFTNVVCGSTNACSFSSADGSTTFVFRKSVSATPVLQVSSAPTKQDFAYAFGVTNGFEQHADNAKGKLIVDWFAGQITKVEDMAYAKMYASMIAFVGLACILGFFFSRWTWLRFSALGNGLMQRRMGTWSGKHGGFLGTFTNDVVPTIQDMLVGEAVVFLIYGAALAVFIGVGYSEFDKIGKSGVFTWGHVAAMHYAFVLLPVQKNSIWCWAFGSSFERLVKWHRILARMAIIFNYIHLITMSVLYGSDIAVDRPTMVKGLVALIFFTLTAAAGFEPIRRSYYKVFIAFHLIFAPLGYIFAFMHVKYNIWFAIPPIILLVLDGLYRLLVRPGFLYSVSTVDASVIVDGAQGSRAGASEHIVAQAGHMGHSVGRVSKLTLDVGGFTSSFEPGSYCFLNIPSISLTQYHPFSVSCYPVPGSGLNGSSRLTFHILDMGRDHWTNRLFNTIQNASSDASGDIRSKIAVRVDGPYGKLQVDLHRYRSIVLIAGGIGITPFLSVLDFLAQQRQKGSQQYLGLVNVHLVWVSRVPSSFEQWAGELLARLSADDKLAAVFKLHLYSSNGGGAGGVASTASRSQYDAGNIELNPVGPVSPSNSDHNNNNGGGGGRLALTPGRPDLVGLFASLVRENAQLDTNSLPDDHAAKSSGNPAHSVAVLACGPSGLVAQAQRIALDNSFHFHKETFHF